jgi:hypothetical protein
MTAYRMSLGAATEAQFRNARRTMLSVSPSTAWDLGESMGVPSDRGHRRIDLDV